MRRETIFMIHILVADDDEKLTQSICSYLNNCG